MAWTGLIHVKELRALGGQSGFRDSELARAVGRLGCDRGFGDRGALGRKRWDSVDRHGGGGHTQGGTGAASASAGVGPILSPGMGSGVREGFGIGVEAVTELRAAAVRQWG